MTTPIESYSGTATIGTTEYSLPGASTTLPTLTAAGLYALLLDLAALTATEQYELRLYETVRTGGTKRLLDVKTISGAQAQPVYLYTPAVPLLRGWDITLKKIAGTDRAIEWSIRNSLDTDTAAIKAKTDNLPASPAAVSDIPTASTVASAVRTNLTTELGRIDAAISTRSTYAGGDTAGVTTLLARVTGTMPLASDWTPGRAAKLDNVDVVLSTRATQTSVNAIPTAPLLAVNYSAPPAAATVATAVRAELAPELARVDVAISTRESEASAATRATADQAEHDATQLAIGGISSGGGSGGSSAAEIAAAVMDSTAGDGTLRDAAARINQVPGTGPVSPIPEAPPLAAMCRVYGYFQTVGGQPAEGVEVTFTLISPGVTANTRLVAGRTTQVFTDEQGRLAWAPDEPWIDLARNDLLNEPGTRYLVRSPGLGVQGAEVTLDTDLVDLRALLLGA